MRFDEAAQVTRVLPDPRVRPAPHEMQARCHFPQKWQRLRNLIVKTDSYSPRRLTGHDLTSARYEKPTRTEPWP